MTGNSGTGRRERRRSGDRPSAAPSPFAMTAGIAAPRQVTVAAVAGGTGPVYCEVGILRIPTESGRGRTSELAVRRSGCGSGEDISLAVQCRDQAIDALVLQDRGEFGTAGRHLADRAVEIDVRNQPGVAIAAHHVIDVDRLSVGFDDLAAHHDARRRGLLTGHLELLSRIAVETGHEPS